MKKTKDVSDRILLLNFLKFGLTTRELDKILGFNAVISKGWMSWKILKSYNINSSDRGVLFCFRKSEVLLIVNSIISRMSRDELNKLFNSVEPRFFNKYKNIYIIANSEEKVAILLSGEVRNITQRFFSPAKRLVSSCQFPGCKINKNLDTVHLYSSRPENLKLACIHGKIINENKYNVYKILLEYIRLHSQKRSLCYLCKSHHNELGSYERVGGKKLIEFRKIISANIQ